MSINFSFPRISSALRYLSWADPIIQWRISRSVCPSCNGKYFLSFSQNSFMTRCLGCSANITNLSLIPVVLEHSRTHHIETCWEMSTYGATLSFLKRNFSIVYESEYMPDSSSGQVVGGIMNQDVQNLSFKDNTIDLITSNQVFEHVPDYVRGFRECYRVLRKGGALIFSIPLYDLPKTERLASIIENKITYYREPEYHGSRIAGAMSALVFWHHSKNDVCETLIQVGFSAKLIDVMIAPSQGNPALVVYAVKI